MFKITVHDQDGDEYGFTNEVYKALGASSGSRNQTLISMGADDETLKDTKEKRWDIQLSLSRFYDGTKADALYLALEDAEHLDDLISQFGIMVKDIDVLYRGEIDSTGWIHNGVDDD